MDSHPSYGIIGAYRVTTGAPGESLFDSDIQHQQSVILRISKAERKRELQRDWIFAREEIIEVQMSEAQWASFVSSMNTSGVPCTLTAVQRERIEGLPFAPRLEESMRDTRDAAKRAFDGIASAFRVYEETPSSPKAAKDEARRTLQATIDNAVPNVAFAGKSLSEHAENVVQKARADVEAMVASKATSLSIEDSGYPMIGSGEKST